MTRRIAPPLPAASMPSKTSTSERRAKRLCARQLGEAALPLAPARARTSSSAACRSRSSATSTLRPSIGRSRDRRRRGAAACGAVSAQSAARIAASERLAHGEGAVVVVGAVDDDPRRPRGAGHAQHVLGDVAGTCRRCCDVLPVCLGHAPARCAGRSRARCRRCFCPRFVEVEPELQQQRALVDEHALEAVDLVEALVELGVATCSPVDAVGDRRRCTRSRRRCRCVPLRRQRAPVAPHVRPLPLLVGRRGEREGPR